jgi:5-methylcytosine-specific restriction enzyme subunit McrC
MIPVQNIYYLLCYAWNHFEEGDISDVASSDFDNVVDLLASVLCRGTGRLLKKGLDRGYLEQEEVLSTIRGRIDVSFTVRHGLHHRGRALCRFDELEYDILHNQILKSTLRRLLQLPGLDSKISNQVRGVYRRLTNIQDIPLTPSLFKRTTLHRNNRYYRFLLHVCELIATYSLPDEKNGGYRFMDFLRDETRMARLFENFVRNFYAREQREYCVNAERLSWPVELAAEGREADLNYLPAMFTDVSLRSTTRTLIIDTKYYQGALTSKYGGAPKVSSGNLYQINTYLSSLEPNAYPDCAAEGLLLYPTNGYDLDLAWKIRGHRVGVRTLDLSQNWQLIHQCLLNMVGINTINEPVYVT